MDTFILIIELLGTFAFAASGATTAIRYKLDIFGTVVLGCTTAVGGGCVRDLILGSIPPAMFLKPIYVTVAVITSVLVFCLFYFDASVRELQTLRSPGYLNFMNFIDALGLAIFVIVGCNGAFNMGYADNAFLVIFVGTLTGVGGGVIRDIFANKIPNLLRKKVYALAAIIGGILYYYMSIFGINTVISIFVTMFVVLIIRLLANRYEWHLPRIPENDKV